MIPLRVKKYDQSGAVVRTIEVTRTASDDQGHPIPADLVVTGGNSTARTIFNGSRIHHGIVFTNQDFTPEALKTLAIPH